MTLSSICIDINIDFERICLLQDNSRASLVYTMRLGQNADHFNGEMATSHYINNWKRSSLTHILVTAVVMEHWICGWLIFWIISDSPLFHQIHLYILLLIGKIMLPLYYYDFCHYRYVHGNIIQFTYESSFWGNRAGHFSRKLFTAHSLNHGKHLQGTAKTL